MSARVERKKTLVGIAFTTRVRIYGSSFVSLYAEGVVTPGFLHHLC